MELVALVVDDSPGHRALVADILRQHHLFERVDEAADGRQAIERLRRPPPVDLVICDAVMPGMDGFEFLAAVRQEPEWADLPIIMLTVLGDPAESARGLRLGASDYVRKPFDEGELLARVRVQLQVRGLRMELQLANARLEALATTDELTGLWNRRAFLERLDQEWSRSVRYGRPFAFVLADLDRFKAINDTYGHQAGDAVLRAAAERLSRVRRPPDLICRYGGEEFALFLPETTLAGGVAAAERLRRALADTPFPVGEGIAPLAVTASFGVSAGPRPEIGSVEALVAAADRALYRSKRAGRNRVTAEG